MLTRGAVTVPPTRVSVMGSPVVSNASRTALTLAVGRRLVQDPPRAGDMRRRHRRPAERFVPAAGHRRRDRVARREERHERRGVREPRDHIVDLSVDPTLMADEMQPGEVSADVDPLLPAAIDGRDVDRAQVVDDRLLGLAVARRREQRSAEAHIDRRDVVAQRRDRVHALETGDDVARERAETRRDAAAAFRAR